MEFVIDHLPSFHFCVYRFSPSHNLPTHDRANLVKFVPFSDSFSPNTGSSPSFRSLAYLSGIEEGGVAWGFGGSCYVLAIHLPHCRSLAYALLPLRRALWGGGGVAMFFRALSRFCSAMPPSWVGLALLIGFVRFLPVLGGGPLPQFAPSWGATQPSMWLSVVLWGLARWMGGYIPLFPASWGVPPPWLFFVPTSPDRHCFVAPPLARLMSAHIIFFPWLSPLLGGPTPTCPRTAPLPAGDARPPGPFPIGLPACSEWGVLPLPSGGPCPPNSRGYVRGPYSGTNEKH